MSEHHLFQDLEEDLKRDEGFRSHPYIDSVGKSTIGYGRNLDDVGISQSEAELLLRKDMGIAFEETREVYPWIKEAPLDVQRGLYNMAFNMGQARLSGFVKMLAALEAKNYSLAAEEALDSKWAEQVGARATRIAELFRNDG